MGMDIPVTSVGRFTTRNLDGSRAMNVKTSVKAGAINSSIVAIKPTTVPGTQLIVSK